MNETTIKAWLARDKNGRLYLFYFEKPTKGETIWHTDGYCEKLITDIFPQVKWEDEEPTELTIKIKEK